MTDYSLAVQEKHEQALMEHFFTPDAASERVAFLLFGSSTSSESDVKGAVHTLLLKELVLLPADSVDASPQHATWSNDLFLPLLKRAAKSRLIVGIAHSHLNWSAEFSSQDDVGEQDLLELVQHRNGPGSLLVSLVFSSHGEMAGRVWSAQGSSCKIGNFRSIGDRYTFRKNYAEPLAAPELARQALVFGDHLNKTIGSLCFALVGCGGTGSAIAMLLARLGARNVVLIDPDAVEISNLNRLHGARHSDALEGKSKVDVVARHIREIAPEAVVTTCQGAVNDVAWHGVLKNADIVFGCTDDNRGRLLINRLAYFYLLPVIDVGLAIEVSQTPPYRVLALDGRVTCIGPGETCLLCRHIISTQRAREESLKAANPAEYERQKQEAYVIGEGNPSPSVVTFTTEVATMAINELIHRLQGFRGTQGSTASRTRQFHRMHDLRPGDKPVEGCSVCGDDLYWGLGDMTPFLDQVW